MRTFFSPKAYRFGSVAAGLAGVYLGCTTLLLYGSFREGVGDGAFMIGFSMLATLPWSFGVMAGYTAHESAQGVPMADQDGGLWMVPAFAACALVNALLIWLIFRGRRIRGSQPDPA
jgi:hypothetical protein